jgi:N-acetylglucosaminyldiphosphoundecaprenol N-acetyl-beta-D-mannosaminyltransferase
MINAGKYNLLGILINAIDYEAVVEQVIQAAQARRSFSVSALAVHGVMTGVLDPEQGYRLNHLDLVVPDGQPVRWALNILYKVGLKDRVYGPTLMLKICDRAAQEGLPIYLYGSQPEVLEALSKNLCDRFSGLRIAGIQPSRFRQVSEAEQIEIAKTISDSGAQIVFVGLGCPRQEVWVYENQSFLKMPTLAVGAAFDFHAGLLPQAPAWMQKQGLEWLFRLIQEPKRLWKRYLYLNPLYLWNLNLQILNLKNFAPILNIKALKFQRFG